MDNSYFEHADALEMYRCTVVLRDSMKLRSVQYKQRYSSDLMINVIFIESMKDLWFEIRSSWTINGGTEHSTKYSNWHCRTQWFLISRLINLSFSVCSSGHFIRFSYLYSDFCFEFVVIVIGFCLVSEFPNRDQRRTRLWFQKTSLNIC